MIRRLFDSIRTRIAVHQHQTSNPEPLELTYSEAYAIQAFRGLGAQTNFPDRLGQAAQLEAHQVPQEAVDALCRISNTGGFNNLVQQAARDAETAGRIFRLQTAVKQLAFIAGPGFTTQHLIDEGMLHEGDI